VEGGARRIRSGEALWIIRQDSKPVHCSHTGPLVFFAPSPSHTIHFLFSENFGARMKKLMLTIALMVNGSVSAQTWRADNGDGTFSNPLFYDEFSDPDLIRVGEDYCLTGTTMHSMPGLPVLHSKDLVNWKLLGYAFDRLDLGPEFRLEDGKDAYCQGIWAPCFRYHNGAFYIFSNVNRHCTQLFRAKNPSGLWTRTELNRSFRNLSVLFDTDGKIYVILGY
jgi:xylan 1,4-beta-xylosidase